MKKNLIVATFLVALIISSLIYFINTRSEKKHPYDRNEFIGNCTKSIKSSNITNQQKIDICNCIFDSLYKIDGDKIFKDDYNYTKSDTLKILNCTQIVLKLDSISRD